MKLKKIAVLIAIAGLSTSAFATNGYFSHGYGIKAKGMGGAGIALPQDSLAAATNPAGMVMVGNSMDLGVDWFRPIRSSELSFGAPFDGTYDGSDTKNFLIPEFGYNRMINPNLSLGVSVYGNGGMNSDYGEGIPLFGAGKAGVNLMQLFIAPTAAYKIAPNHAVGFSLNLAYQRFSADGLQGFDSLPPSASPGNVTNRDNDTSKGVGFRIGYTGKMTDMVTVGATYQSKTKMSKFSKYKGLFAEGGDFDIPENYGIGIAVKATPALTVAFDVVEIKYSDIKSIANPVDNLFVLGQLMGSKNGPGFGWKDMTVYKLGASYEFSKNLTLRAGYNHGGQPIPTSQTMFNILAPGVVENHLTLGATWTLANKDEVSVSYMHAFENKVKGSGAFGTGINLKMKQDSLGLAYSWKM
jgi:long-chain fatty acid transport protein